MSSVFRALNCDKSFIKLKKKKKNNNKKHCLFTKDLIEAIRTVNRHFLFHLLSGLLLNRMCSHIFHV